MLKHEKIVEVHLGDTYSLTITDRIVTVTLARIKKDKDKDRGIVDNSNLNQEKDYLTPDYLFPLFFS